MKKLFSEAEVEVTLLSALEDVLSASADGDGGNLDDVQSDWDGWN